MIRSHSIGPIEIRFFMTLPASTGAPEGPQANLGLYDSQSNRLHNHEGPTPHRKSRKEDFEDESRPLVLN